LLNCELNGTPLKWGFCGSYVDESGYTITFDILTWNNIVGDGCNEVEIHVKDVPKTFGNQTTLGSYA
jgi:hypothetical protein